MTPEERQFRAAPWKHTRSSFIRALIARTPFEPEAMDGRNTVAIGQSASGMRRVLDLLYLEGYLRFGIHSVFSGWAYSSLRGQYPEEYLAILRDLNERRYLDALAAQAARRDAETQREVERRARNEVLRRDWLDAGGQDEVGRHPEPS